MASPTPTLAEWARLGLRLIACAIGAVALWQLVANVAEAVPAFDPNYLGYFLKVTCLRPALGLAVALALALLAGPLGRRL